jgi:hypothetical protein
MDQRRRLAPLLGAVEGGQPPLRPPKLTSGAGGDFVRVTSLGQLEHWNTPRPTATVAWPQRHIHLRSRPRAHESPLVPPIDPAHRRDAGRTPAPSPVSPLAPPGLSPIGKGGSGVPVIRLRSMSCLDLELEACLRGRNGILAECDNGIVHDFEESA